MLNVFNPLKYRCFFFPPFSWRGQERVETQQCPASGEHHRERELMPLSVYWDLIKCQHLSHQKAASHGSSLNVTGRAVSST